MTDKSIFGNIKSQISSATRSDEGAARTAVSRLTGARNENFSNEGRNSQNRNENFSNEGRNFRGVQNPVPPAPVYTHKTDNITTNKELVFDFQPNVLDNFDAFTYHWKLFLVSIPDAIDGNILDVTRQSVIAESAVTDMTIDKVVLQGLAVPGLESGTGTQTRVKFEILEPSGAALLDKMFFQALSLDIDNWLTMPVFLQLSFKARTPEESESVIDGSPGELASSKWIWPLKLSKAAANVTHVGTRYDFEAILYDELAQSNLYFTIQHNASLRELTTFGSAMKELENKLNTDQLLKLIDNYGTPDVYRIVVEPSLASCNIISINGNQNSVRSNDFLDFDKKTATINAGTGIDKIVDALLSNTDKYQKEFPDAPVPGAEGSPMNQQTSQMKKFWRIVTDSRPIKYDKRRQTYANTFTVYVIPYDIGVMPQNIFQQASGAETLSASQKRLATYVNQDILKKKYNYIFTGLNDQIINFDLALNFAFSTEVARFGGIYVNGAIQDKGVVNQNNSEKEREVTEKVRKVVQLQNDATRTTPEISTAIQDARQSFTANAVSDERRAQLESIIERSKPENRLNLTQDSLDRIRNARTLETKVLNAKQLAEPLSDRLPAFVSDVQLNSDATRKLQEYLNSGKGKLWPIAATEGKQEKAVGAGVESSSNSGIAKVSSLFALALNSGMDANLQRITMTIKGDPFWLYPAPVTGDRLFRLSNLSESAAIDYIQTSHKTRGNSPYSSVNTYSTDNFFVLRFRSPRVYNNQLDENDDSNENSDVETFSGVYRATEIVSTFEGGKFTQQLTGILDPDINIKEFLDKLNLADMDAGRSALDKQKTIPGGLTLPDSTRRGGRIVGDLNIPNGVSAINVPTLPSIGPGIGRGR
jgi:hypothetical protein